MERHTKPDSLENHRYRQSHKEKASARGRNSDRGNSRSRGQSQNHNTTVRRKGQDLKVEIINEEHNLLAVGPELLPEEYRGHILVFYVPRMDAVALSKDNPAFAELAEFMKEYLSANNHARKSVLDQCSSDVTSKELIEIIHVLDRIIRIRRKLCRRKK